MRTSSGSSASSRWNQIDQASGTFSGFRARTILLTEPAKDETKRSSMRSGSRADCRTWKDRRLDE